MFTKLYLVNCWDFFFVFTVNFLLVKILLIMIVNIVASNLQIISYVFLADFTIPFRNAKYKFNKEYEK